MDRRLDEILKSLGPSGLSDDERAACASSPELADALAAEESLDALLEMGMPELDEAPDAISRILAAAAASSADEGAVLRYLDGEMSGAERRSYEAQRAGDPVLSRLEASHRELWELLDEGLPPLPRDRAAEARVIAAVQELAAPVAAGAGSVQKARRYRSRAGRKAQGPLRIGPWVWQAAAAALVAASLGWMLLSDPSDSGLIARDPTPRPEAPREAPQLPGSEQLREGGSEGGQPDELQHPTEGIEAPRGPVTPPERQPERGGLAQVDPQEEPADGPVLAGLSEEDLAVIENMELLEQLDELQEYDLVMSSEILTALTIEDFE